jgi:predicted transcriptional regulator
MDYQDLAGFAMTRLLFPQMWAKSLGISRCKGRDMPMVAQPLCELPTLGILFFEQTARSRK